MAIRIKRSSGNTAPSSLASGQLAYVEGATNGGTLYYGEIGGTVREIAGKKFVDKLNGIASNAIANVVEDLTPQLGGALDVNGQSIVSVSNGNITLAPNGSGKVIISGDLQVDGTTTSVNSTTLDVADKNITVAKGAANAAAANGAGLTVEGPATPATILYASSDDSWNFNKKTTATELQVDNININGNTISSTDTDGSITLTPNGIGDVQLLADTILVGDSGVNVNVTSNGVADLILSTNGAVNSGAITISGSNSPITLEPHGTGDVHLRADTVQVGDQNSAATVTTWGTGNLVLNTNAGTNSGSITIAQGANGAITLAPNGTGSVVLTGPSIATITAPSANTAALQIRNAVTSSATDTYPSVMIVKHRTDIALASMTDEPAVINFTVRDNTSTNRQFGRLIGRYQGTGSNPVFTLRGSPDGFTSNLHYFSFGGGVGTFGSTSSDYTLTANTGGALKLSANNNTTSGVITIASGADGTISLVPNGVGKLLLNTVYWPLSDGSANQVLKTDGAGQASWVTLSSLVSDTNTTYSVSAETATGGANLRLTGSDASTDDVAIIGGTNVTVTRTDANTITISSADTGITDLVQDTTPQLGGNLDVNGNSIVSVSNGNIAITPNGTGSIVLDGLNWPQTDGTANYVLKTDGSGQLSWVAQTVDTNTTYSISAETATGGANLRLTGNDSSTDDVKIAGGTNVTVTRTDANTITISSTDTGATAFTGLTDVPASYSGSGGYYVKVNSGATALEFSQDIDDGTF